MTRPLQLTMSDEGDLESLVRRAAGGDLDAFEEILRTRQEKCFRIACQIVGDADDAMDVCQESFLKLHESLGRYKPQVSFDAWLYRLVVNTAIDFMRREKRDRRVSLTVEPQDRDVIGMHDLRLSLENCLADLSPKQRTAFTLRDLQQFPLEEVAAVMHCTAATVRVHLHHARRRIRQSLEDTG